MGLKNGNFVLLLTLIFSFTTSILNSLTLLSYSTFLTLFLYLFPDSTFSIYFLSPFSHSNFAISFVSPLHFLFFPSLAFHFVFSPFLTLLCYQLYHSIFSLHIYFGTPFSHSSFALYFLTLISLFTISRLSHSTCSL